MKIFGIALATALLAGCTAGSVEASGLTTAGEAKTSAVNPIEVEEGIFTVDVTIAASFYAIGGGATRAIADKAVQENGFISGVINPDGSVTFTMTKIQQESYLKELSQSIRDSLADTAADSPEVTSINANDEFTEFNVLVDAGEFSTFTRFIGLGLAFSASAYQMFSGVENFKATINYVDNASGEILDSIRFPVDETRP